MAFPRRLATSLLAAICVASYAESSQSDVGERYHDAQRCMEQAMGKHWSERFGVELTRNKWGVDEAVEASINAAPQAVRVTDLRCRRQVGIAGKPRP